MHASMRLVENVFGRIEILQPFQSVFFVASQKLADILGSRKCVGRFDDGH